MVGLPGPSDKSPLGTPIDSGSNTEKVLPRPTSWHEYFAALRFCIRLAIAIPRQFRSLPSRLNLPNSSKIAWWYSAGISPAVVRNADSRLNCLWPLAQESAFPDELLYLSLYCGRSRGRIWSEHVTRPAEGKFQRFPKRKQCFCNFNLSRDGANVESGKKVALVHGPCKESAL